MSRKQMRIAALVTFIIGIALISYPFVSDYYYKQKQYEVLSLQKQKVAQIQNSNDFELERQKQRAYEYNESISKGICVITDPFDPNRKKVTTKDYNSSLNLLGDGVMGSIDIPCINTSLTINHSVSDDVLAKGVGHIENSSLPIGGKSSHCVLTGHTGLPSKIVFDDLNKVKVGDYFVINVLGEDHAYEVRSIDTVLPDETDSLSIKQGEDWCTLVTCTPYGINSHRLLVHGKRIAVPTRYYNKDENAANLNQGFKLDKIVVYSLSGVVAGLGIVFSYMYFTKRKNNEDE